MIVFDSNYILEFLNVIKEKDSLLNDFVERYSNIIKLDKKKPLFSLTNRYSSFPKYKTDRYKKHAMSKGANAWIPNKSDKNIPKIIKGILNKITDTNYKICCHKLLTYILNVKSYELFSILTTEIFEKCIYDLEYHNIFIELCKNIWENKKINLNVITSFKKDNKFYWRKNKENAIEHGPFDTEIEIKKHIYENVNFQKELISYFIYKFQEREEYFKNSSLFTEDENYKNKQKILSIFMFITKLYLNNYTDGQYINFLFDQILTTKVYEEDIECIYKIMKVLTYDKYPQMEKYLNILESNKVNYHWNKRISFFFNEILAFREEQIANSIEYDVDYYLTKYMKNKITINKLINEISSKEGKTESIIFMLLEDIKNIDKYLLVIKKLYELKSIFRKDLVYTINTIITEYEDFIIDIPNLDKYFSLLVNKLSNLLSYTFCNNKFVLTIKKNIKDDLNKVKISISLINNINRITDSAFEQLLEIVDTTTTNTMTSTTATKSIKNSKLSVSFG